MLCVLAAMKGPLSKAAGVTAGESCVLRTGVVYMLWGFEWSSCSVDKNVLCILQVTISILLFLPGKGDTNPKH